jgi:hypothetical protein
MTEETHQNERDEHDLEPWESLESRREREAWRGSLRNDARRERELGPASETSLVTWSQMQASIEAAVAELSKRQNSQDILHQLAQLQVRLVRLEEQLRRIERQREADATAAAFLGEIETLAADEDEDEDMPDDFDYGHVLED